MEDRIDEVVRKTAKERMTEGRVANLQELMDYFDPELAADIGNFVLGKLYSRSVIPWKTRQLCAIAALTVLYRPAQLRQRGNRGSHRAGGHLRRVPRSHRGPEGGQRGNRGIRRAEEPVTRSEEGFSLFTFNTAFSS